MFWFTSLPRGLGWLRWFGEAQFWRDVMTRALAGLVVVGVGYVFGVSAGTLPPPTNKNIAFDVVIVVVSFVVSVVIAFFCAVGLDLAGVTPTKTLVIPGGDPFRGFNWDAMPWWKKAPLYLARFLVLSLPLWGTVGLSMLALGLFSP